MPITVKISETLLFSIMCGLSIWMILESKVTEAQQAQCGDLPAEEKNAFGKIVTELGRPDWITMDPCDNQSWSFAQTLINNATIICSCAYLDGLYHIESISFLKLDLPGVLPSSLVNLPYLKLINLNRNYLSGTIPPEWASLKLEFLSLSANRLSGQIPEFLGNLTNLTVLGLENNFFNGSIPPELGKLVNLQKLILSANFLTGGLPKELLKLKNVNELRISSNNFTGKLPDFLGWNNLNQLELQATGFQGPIPSSISALTNLTELKISDLKGDAASAFPRLGGMRGMQKLMLRSCNLIGPIPSPFPSMPGLMRMDLSFNRLEGGIPDVHPVNFKELDTLYLTGNSLSGPIPPWILQRDLKLNIDLSYNNLSENSVPANCEDTSLNLFRSYHGRDSSELVKCLPQCKKDYYSFHVNCGGKATRIGTTTFDGNEELAKVAIFIPAGENWGMSMTGNFWYQKDVRPTEYIANNVSVLEGKDSELYTTARLSPLSLTYYGRCLANGHYTVTLHFAEIVFRDNRSFQSLGRRFFDVYIQGVQKLKDFNIEHEAGGVDKVILQTFKSILVRNKTLEIRFHYAGKGTTDIPIRGTYGPLISAISVESEFKQPLSYRSKIFIALGASLFLILMALLFSYYKGYIGGRIPTEEVLRGLDLRTGLFTFKQIQAATNNFDAANKIGEGGFGSVYKGTLLDGTIIAVKQLSSNSKQGKREFVNEIGVISCLQHPNLVKLYGCCIEESNLLLAYEFVENNSLANALFGPEENQLEIDWPTRQNICLGIANGLVYLHEESTLKIVHRDIKANNILLDKDLNPKISDFGLAKLDEEENTHITTRVAGTIGYMAPEYALWGYLTYKADVYSFGVVVLEIVSGKSNMKYRPNENCVCLLDWALVLQKQGRLLELVDPRLNSNIEESEAEKLLGISLLCTNPSPTLRPTMSEVVSMLQGHTSIREFNMDTNEYNNELNLHVLRERYHDSYIGSSLTHPTATCSFPSKPKDMDENPLLV